MPNYDEDGANDDRGDRNDLETATPRQRDNPPGGDGIFFYGEPPVEEGK